jgi:hypothetical protein
MNLCFLPVSNANGRAMDSYVVRIYRRDGKKSRILIGTVEVAGTGRKMAFSNTEELWEILRRRKCGDLCVPPSPRRCLRKEVMSATVGTDLEESAEGVRQIKSDL